MTLDEFIQLIQTQANPSSFLSPALQALWHQKKGNWHKAHEIVQNASDADSAWVHACLHRQEGDIDNARYWYRRSSKSEFKGTIFQEWEQITNELLREN